MNSTCSVEITGLNKEDGPLTKSISLTNDGSIKSDGGECVMARGTAARVPLSSIGQLADVILKMGSQDAIALGALRSDQPSHVKVVTKRKLKGKTLAGTIARTADFINYRTGMPALALLDFDKKGLPSHVEERITKVGGVWHALVSVLPELCNTARLVRASTSAGLYRRDTRALIPGSGGEHIYPLIADGADIERFLKALHERCWLAGFGWMMVGRAGQLLERSIVDRMVGAPERLVFEDPPVLKDPLAQDEEKRRPRVTDGSPLDTVRSCPPLRIVEQSKLRELRAKEKDRLGPEAAKTKKRFQEEQIKALVDRTNMPEDQARQVIERMSGGILLPDIVLPFDDPELHGKTVGDVLADPAAFAGETLADPLEGIEYGACKAMIMRDADGAPWVNSFAHGSTIYKLRYDAPAVRRAIDRAPKDKDAVQTFTKYALNAELDDSELEELRDYAAQHSGINKSTVGKILKTAKKAQTEQHAEAARDRRLAERSDPRPPVTCPSTNAPWLPQMGVINDVLGTSPTGEPPMRDVDGYVAQVRERELFSLHTLTAAGSNAEETADTRLPPPRLQLLTRPDNMQLAEMIEEHIDYIDNNGISVHLPGVFVAHYRHRPDDKALPTVKAISTLPLIMPDRTILSGRGLNRRTGIVFRVPDALEALLPNQNGCTATDVARSMHFLTEDWLVDVATDYPGKCIIIAKAISIIQRLLLPERPAFFLTAGQRGGGKSTADNMISTAVLGHRAPAAAWSPSEEERRKALFAYLSEGIPFLVWDNIPRAATISCPAIEKTLTAESISDRVLGVSETRTVSAQTIMSFTGNNITPRADMASRALISRINVDRPDPENREFQHADPLAWTEANRGRILASRCENWTRWLG